MFLSGLNSLGNFNSPSVETQQQSLSIVILGHRAEDPEHQRQSIEFITKTIIIWILGSVPENDECGEF